MSSNFFKILGVSLFVGAMIGVYQLVPRLAVPERQSAGDEDRIELEETSERTDSGPEPVAEDQGKGSQASDSTGPTGEWAPFESLTLEPSHPRVAFFDPASVEGQTSLVVVGAPGIWPPETMTTERNGTLYLPDTDVETFGGRRTHHYEVMARSSRNSLAYWESLSFEVTSGSKTFPTRRLALEPASPVRVRAVGSDGEPVTGAEIRLSRRTVGFVSLTKRTGPDGIVTFRAIPAGGYIVSIDAAAEGEERTTFDHEPPVRTSLTLEGQPTPNLESSRVESNESETTSNVRPRDITFRIEGLSASRWREVDLHWRERGGEWQPATVETPAETGAQRWRRRLEPGAYELRLVDELGNAARRNFQVGDGLTDYTWRAEIVRSVDLYVTDRSGQPVEGALVQVWRDDRQVDSGFSRGGAPFELSLEVEASSYRIVAIDARRGEGSRVVRPGGLEGREVVIRLDSPLFSSEKPPERIRSRARIEEILEVPLVRDGEAWLVDAVDPNSRAVRSGLQRADRLMSLHRVEDGWEVILERNGQIVIERLTLPAAE